MIETCKRIVRKIKMSKKVITTETIELHLINDITTLTIQGDMISMTIKRVTEDRGVGIDHKIETIKMIIHLEKPLNNRQYQAKSK